MGAIYRIRQGLAGLRPAVRPEDRALLERYLSPEERALFERMQPADQCHSLSVLRTLLEMGVEETSLLKAALLHDVGKSRCRLGVFHRTAAVLMRTVFGGVPQFLSWRPDGSYRLPFYVIVNHPRIGASMLVRAGTEERVWRLVELHQLEPHRVGGIPDAEWVRRALAILRRADNEN